MPQQTDKWEQYADPAPSKVDRWNQYEAEPTDTPALKSSHEPIDFNKLGSAAIASHMTGLPITTAYDNYKQVGDAFAKHSVAAPQPSTISKDITTGLQNSIFALAYRNKMPDSLSNPTHMDNIISGLATMVADLPVYIAGSTLGGAAGSEIPGVGNVAGMWMGGFAVPAALRESLTEGIRKGDIKSFPDLVERTIAATYAGAKGALIGRVTGIASAATIPLKGLLGPAAPAAEAALKLAQTNAALTTVSALSEGRIPTADEFVVNSALLVAMHTTMGAIEKAGPQVTKVHDRVLNEYSNNGTHPATIAAEALTRAQEFPTEDVLDRINSISRDITTPEETTDKGKEPTEPKEALVPPDQPAASYRPAIREEDGTVHIGGEGEFHPDIVERTGVDDERGFVDRKDEFHTREETKARLHTEEPEIYKLWEQEAGGPNEEFHTTDYNEAVRKSTGVKNASVDVQRAQRGLPPLESDDPTKRADVYAQAKEDVDSGKVDPLQIAESINNSPRGISDSETDALNYYNAKLSNQHAATMDAIEKARADDDPVTEAKARERLQDIERKQDTVEQAVRKAGTQSGRAMRARQDMIKQDYSLDRVLQRARIASKTGEVSPDVRDQLETLTAQLKDANNKLEAYQEKQERQSAQQAVDRMKEDTAREGRKAARKEERIALDTELDDLVKQFDSLIMGRVSANPFLDPEAIGLLGKMAKNRIESGMTRIEDIVDYVHGELTNLGHEFSKREIRDAISGYGKIAEMSKDAINVALREAKRQGKLISALEDAQAAVTPLKSGLQRDAATDRVRELTKQVKAAMRESGIDVQPTRTPEQKWKSALDSVKTRLRNQISDLTKQIQSGEKAVNKRKGVKLDPEAQALKDVRDHLLIKQKQEDIALRLKLREALQSTEGKPGVHPETKIKAAMASVEKSIAEYERRIKENDLTPTQRKAGVPETPELKVARERRDSLVEVLRQLRENAKPKKAPEVAALERYKKQLTNRIDDMERQLKTGDFSKEPNKPLVLDSEATALKVKAEKTRRAIDEAIAKQKRESRTGTEKVADFVTKWRRAGLLTGYTTLSKLTKAAMDRMGVTPVEELLGGVLSKIPGISEISKRAPMHGGGLNISAEIKAISQLWNKATAKDMWDALEHGQDSLDLLFGGKAKLPPEVLGFFGQLHGALKVPEKRAEFFRRFEIGMEYAKKNNLDVNDPRVQSAVGLRSYLESQRAILMQENVLTNAYSVMLAYLHNQGALGRTFETGARFMFPMVRVATNLPGEALSYTPPALVVRGAEVFKILADKNRMGKSAFDNLSLHDMDNIMRGLKKGSVGLALFGIGFAFRNRITGYYLDEADEKRGVKRGIMKIGGVTIPSYLNDTPPLIAIQLAATVGHVWDHYRMKGMSGGLVAGLVQAAQELGKRVPFYGQVARSAEGASTPERSMVSLGDLAGSLIIPRLVSQIAEANDPEKDRKAETFGEAIKLQIPGLRETVPAGKRGKFSLKGNALKGRQR